MVLITCQIYVQLQWHATIGLILSSQFFKVLNNFIQKLKKKYILIPAHTKLAYTTLPYFHTAPAHHV